MTISLTDLPIAVKTYLGTKVTVNVENVRPKTGNIINIGEDFLFDVSASNAGGPDGIALKNVVYFIYVTDDTKAKLYVPSNPSVTARSIPTRRCPSSMPLTPGSLVAGMCIASTLPDTHQREYPDLQNYLGVGEKDTIRDLSGKALGIGDFAIGCWITGDMDLDFLFSAGASSATGQGTVSIADL